MTFFESGLGSGLIVFLAGMFLVTEFMVKSRGLAGIAGLGLLVFYSTLQNPEMNLWMIGILLIGLMMLVLDGKFIQDGTLAAIGLVLMLIGLVIPTGDWMVGTVVGAMWIFGILCGFLSLKVLPRRDMWERMVLKSTLTREEGYSSINSKYRDLVGKKGVTVTDLRPTGTIEIEGDHYSGVSNGMWVKKDTPLQVISVDGTRILVEPLQEGFEEGESRNPD